MSTLRLPLTDLGDVPGVPVLGSMLDLRRDILAVFTDAMATGKPVATVRAGPMNLHVLNDPAAIKHALVDEVRRYRKSRSYDGIKLVLGNGLLTSEGEFWKRQRRLAQPAFHHKRLAGFAEQMTTATAAMLARWRERRGEIVDVHFEMTRLTLRIVGQTLFGVDLDAQAKELADAVDVVLHFANDYASALLRVPVGLPLPRNLRFRRAMAVLDGKVKALLADARARVARGDDAGSHLLGMLMQARDEETGEAMSDAQLRDETLTVLGAGHETTASLLSFALYLLSLHPTTARALAAEVDAAIGQAAPTMADLPKMPLLSRVVHETLRLYPSAWGFDRVAVEPDEIGGVRIEPGDFILLVPWALHRDPKLWENPEGFDPDRFLPEAVERRHKYAFLPFGGGPRICIGNQLALVESQLVLAMIVREFAPSLAPGHRLRLDPSTTLRPADPLRMALTPRPSPRR
jgi:cytochrome P450